MISLKQISHLELLEYRELNEVAFVGWAAERRTEADLAAMQACLESARAVTDDLDAFIASDIKFHELLTASAHNGVLSIVNRVLSRIILDLLRTRLHEYPIEESRRMCREILKMHNEIYQAIARQDSARAQENDAPPPGALPRRPESITRLEKVKANILPGLFIKTFLQRRRRIFMKKEILSGNEAVARGAYEAGCAGSGSLPGHPQYGNSGKCRFI